MAGGTGRRAAPPDAEIAATYVPIVRGFFLAAALYYALITASHPFYETGKTLAILAGLSMFTSVLAAGLWLQLKRRPPTLLALEGAVLVVNALFMANVVAYLLIHFEPLKLFYFVLMALAFATSAPTRRVMFVSVAAAEAGLLLLARNAPGDLVNQYGFVGVAGAFAAIGLATLMRGAVMRELRARLVSDALNLKLTSELEENQRLQAKTQALAVAAQGANRAKTEFLATISHEIRTPLNGVMGMAQVMEMAPLADDQRERLAIIQSSARTLLGVVNDVLDISKIEAGKMDIEATNFSLDAFADAIRRLYGGLARDKGLAFAFDVDPAVRGWRRGDEVRLRQVISNLISNAVKFTDTGSIVVRASGDAERLRFSVADTGVGIPADRRGQIFEKFVQADASTTRRAGGTGLGLAICRELVTLMDGSIDFETELGVGTRFAFDIPFAAVEAPARDAGLASGRPGRRPELRLLVVDDNATNRAVIQALLSPLGVATEAACHGREAVSAWEAGGWDAILMDIHMPEMDGLDASRAIREREAATGRARTPIIAVTASVLAHETAAYFDAGMDGVVAKPIEIRRLMEVVEDNLAPAKVRADRRASAS